jgi:hypothetical protein
MHPSKHTNIARIVIPNKYSGKRKQQTYSEFWIAIQTMRVVSGMSFQPQQLVWSKPRRPTFKYSDFINVASDNLTYMLQCTAIFLFRLF